MTVNPGEERLWDEQATQSTGAPAKEADQVAKLEAQAEAVLTNPAIQPEIHTPTPEDPEE